MHAGAGIVKDTVRGCLLMVRYKEWVLVFEMEENGNRFDGKEPFAAATEELPKIEEALQHIVNGSDSRVAGSRVLRLLHRSKKNKSHAMSLMASDYGEMFVYWVS